MQRKIPDSNEVDIFTKIAEINKRLGSSKSFVEYGDIATGNSKNAIKCLRGPKSCLWPRSRDGNVYIPYTLDTYFTKEQQKTIYDAMQEFDDLTCIKFIYRRHQMNYIKIIAGDGSVLLQEFDACGILQLLTVIMCNAEESLHAT